LFTLPYLKPFYTTARHCQNVQFIDYLDQPAALSAAIFEVITAIRFISPSMTTLIF